MQDLVSVYNDSPHPRYLGDQCIPPGETRQVLRVLVPQEAPDPVTEAPTVDAIDALRDMSVSVIRERFIGLTQDDLVQLNAREEAAAKPRRTLLEAIAEELLARGDALAEAPL